MVKSKNKVIIILTIVLFIVCGVLGLSMFDSKPAFAKEDGDVGTIPMFSTLATYDMFTGGDNPYFAIQSGATISSFNKNGNELYAKKGALTGYANMFSYFTLSDNLFIAAKNGVITVSVSASLKAEKGIWCGQDSKSAYITIANGTRTGAKFGNFEATSSNQGKVQSTAYTNASAAISGAQISVNGFRFLINNGTTTAINSEVWAQNPRVSVSSTDNTAPTMTGMQLIDAGNNVKIIMNTSDSQAGVMSATIMGVNATRTAVSGDTKTATYEVTVAKSQIVSNGKAVSYTITDNVGNTANSSSNSYSYKPNTPSATLTAENYGGWFVNKNINVAVANNQTAVDGVYYYTLDGSNPTTSSPVLNGGNETLNFGVDNGTVTIKVILVQFGAKSDIFTQTINIDTTDYVVSASSDIANGYSITSSLPKTKKRNQPITASFSILDGYCFETLKNNADGSTLQYSGDGKNFTVTIQSELDIELYIDLFEKLENSLQKETGYTYNKDGIIFNYQLPSTITNPELVTFNWYRLKPENAAKTRSSLSNDSRYELVASGVNPQLGAGAYVVEASYCDDSFSFDVAVSPKKVNVWLTSEKGEYSYSEHNLAFNIDDINCDYTFVALKNDVESEIFNVGVYKIKVTVNPNYVFEGEITYEVYKKTLNITAKNATAIYGDADSALEYDIVGYFEGDASLIGGLYREEGKNVGTYAIKNGFSSENYDIKFTSADYVIIPRDINVTPNSGQSKTYGESDTELAYGVGEGELISGDTLAGFLSRKAGEDVGSYEIFIGNLSNSNYNIIFNSSVAFEIKPINLTVTPNSGQSKIYGNSDTKITYSITDGALINGDVLSGTLTRVAGGNAGNYEILINDLYNKNYNITLSKVDFIINPRTIIITPTENQSKIYGDDDRALDYSIKGMGLVNGDKLTGSLARLDGDSCGEYDIVIGNIAAGANYVLQFESGVKFNIKQRTIYVRANNGESQYGDPFQAVTYESDSLYYSDKFEGSLDIKGCNGSVGKYEIVQNTLSLNDNYIINFTSGEYTITKRIVIVNFDSSANQKIYGSKDKDIVFTVSNFLAGDFVKLLATRVEGENAGFYALSVTGLDGNPNYTAEYVNAVYQILARDVMIRAFDNSKVYGDSDPILEYGIVAGSFIEGDEFGFLTREKGENVGEYKYTSNGFSSNYRVEIMGNAKFTITKRVVTVTPKSGQTKVYGEKDIIDFIAQNIVEGDNLNNSLTRIVGENVGEYLIGLGSLSNSNYDIIFTEGVVYTIIPRDITVTPNADQSSIYGDNAVIGYSVENIFADDSLLGELAISGTNAGKHSIEQNTLTAENNANYNITFVSGVVYTVQPRSIVVTPNANQTGVYGDVAVIGYTADNIVEGDKLDGELSIDGKDVGNYEINLGTLNNPNYSISFNNGITFEIIPREVMIELNNPSRQYGYQDDLSYTVKNILNGDEVSGALERIIGEDVGSYDISISNLSVGSNYILSCNQKYNITKRDLVIDIGNATKTYGDDDCELAYTSKGGIDGDALDLFISREIGENVGSYAITTSADGIPAYYNVTINNGKLDILRRKITVTARSFGKNYGVSDSELLFTTKNAVSGDEIFGSLERESGENVGDYNILQGTITNKNNPNYDITFEKGVLTINRKTVIVTPNRLSKVYGDSDPALTYTATGLVADDKLVGALTRTAGENANTYAISIGTLTNANNPNYNIDLKKGNFEIKKANCPVFPTLKSGVYTGNAQKITVKLDSLFSGFDLSDYSFMCDGEKGEFVNGYLVFKNIVNAKNDYYIAITFAGSENYNEGIKNIMFKVERAPVRITVVRDVFEQGTNFDEILANNPSLIYVLDKDVESELIFAEGANTAEIGTVNFTIRTNDVNYNGIYEGTLKIIAQPTYVSNKNVVTGGGVFSEEIVVEVIVEDNKSITSAYNQFVSDYAKSNSLQGFGNKNVNYVVRMKSFNAESGENVTFSGPVTIKFLLKGNVTPGSSFTIMSKGENGVDKILLEDAVPTAQNDGGVVEYFLSFTTNDSLAEFIVISDAIVQSFTTLLIFIGIGVIGLSMLFIARRRRFSANRPFNNKFFMKSKTNKLPKKQNFAKF